MFRRLRRTKQELDLNRVKEILNKGKYGVLSLVMMIIILMEYL